MLNDSVLLSALIFFASSGIVWFYLVRVQKSNFKPKIKRILVYLSITILFIIVVIIFNYHSTSFILSKA